MNILLFLKNIKKWKHTVNYKHFEYIFRKSDAFSVVFEGKIRFSKKVKNRNLLASEPKKYKKHTKNTKMKKTNIFVIFNVNCFEINIPKSEIWWISLLNVGISRQVSRKQDHTKPVLRGGEPTFELFSGPQLSSSWAKILV